jgi:hypothetical protein
MRIKKDVEKYIISADTDTEERFLDMLILGLSNTYSTVVGSDVYQANQLPPVEPIPNKAS